MAEPTKRPLTENYWEFLSVRDTYSGQQKPAVPAWMAYGSDSLTPVERLYFDHIAAGNRVLDEGQATCTSDRSVGLATYLHLRGVECTIYRANLTTPTPTPRERLLRAAAKLITRGILQVDYAHGVMLLRHRRLM